MDSSGDDRQAARRLAFEVRGRASDRGRRLFLAAIGLSAALSGAFGALAAALTHPKKGVRSVPAARATSVNLPAPHATAPSATPPSSGQDAAPVAPAEPPAVAVAPPVATSGGS